MSLRKLPRTLVNALRSRRGAPEVQYTPSAVRGGNILYYWQWAYLQRAGGARASVLTTPHAQAWLDEFPALRELTVDDSEVRLPDRRVFATRHHFGTSFSADQNLEFCRWLLEHSPAFRDRLAVARSEFGPETCVVNVRRGDYYSVPAFRREFAIDIKGHVTEALSLLQGEDRPISGLLLVSDDPQWCRDELAPLLPTEPRFVTWRRSMFDDLATLASARSLVLANSTFSYWGSHLALAMDEDHLAIAPAHHQRLSSGGWMDDMLDPRWSRTTADEADS